MEAPRLLNHSIFSPTGIAIAGSTLVVVMIIISKTRREKRLPPSPGSWVPIIGHLYLIRDPLHRCLHRLSARYGPILSMSFGSRRVLVVSSAPLVEECFAKNDVVLANRPRTLATKHLHNNNTTIGAADHGDHWRNLRRLTALEILSTNRLNGSLGIREEEVRFLVRDLFRTSTTALQGCSQVEMKSRLSELSFNVITRMVAGKRYFGKEVGEDPEEAKRFRDLISETFELSGLADLSDHIPLLRWLGFGSYEKKLVDVGARIDKNFQGLIDEHRNKRATDRGDQANGTGMTMVDVVLRLQESEPEYYSDEIIRGLILILINAGTDTSAVTMEWTLSLLLNHPNVMARVQTEIHELVGHRRLVNESDLPKLEYLSCIVNETLRLFPPAPLLVPHQASADLTLGGYHVPKGTMLLVNAWAVHRSPDCWADPDNFRPERFQGVDVGEAGYKYKFLPFGVGRRACPGMGLANRVVGLGLATLIQCFDWEKVRDGPIDMTEGTGLTIPKLDPLVAVCRPKSDMVHVLSNI